jgi:phenylpropionate dioxygenase-like ring-hydroxylating dioxygenase large terminal subunit
MSVNSNRWLDGAWYIACATSRVNARKPLALVMSETPVVLFRTPAGVTALLDRCPHRNVPLSLGEVEAGSIRCRYHGWRFDGAGQCVEIPSRLTHEPLKSQCVASFATFERDGYVWLYSTPNMKPADEPQPFKHLDAPGYTSVKSEFLIEGDVFGFLENTLDVPHTAFLHGGLFRTAQKTNTVHVNVSRHLSSAEAEFIGEPAPKGVVGRLLAPSGAVVTHVDRFSLPSIAQVEYSLGTKSHFIATSALTPVDRKWTRIFAVVTFRLPVPGWLVRPFVAPVARRIFSQDAVILKAQQRNIEHFEGPSFVSTELDVLGPQIQYLLRAAQNKTPVQTHAHETQIRT